MEVVVRDALEKFLMLKKCPQSLEPSTRYVSAVSYAKDRWITQILLIMTRMFTANNAIEEILMFDPVQMAQQVQTLLRVLRVRIVQGVGELCLRLKKSLQGSISSTKDVLPVSIVKQVYRPQHSLMLLMVKYTAKPAMLLVLVTREQDLWDLLIQQQ